MKNDTLRQVNYLLQLAAKNQSEQIKESLATLKGTSKFKGDVFEHFIARLYSKTGWNTQVTGGKNDKGVDILRYHPEDSVKVEAIIQTKNLKIALSTKELRHEYNNFFGDNFSHSKGSSELHNCNKLIIISLNGYTKDAENFHHPHEKTHQVIQQDWSDIKTLIETYSSKHTSPKTVKRLSRLNINLIWLFIEKIKTITKMAKENIAMIVIILVILVFVFTDDLRNAKHEYTDYILTDAMIERLHEATLTENRKVDCKTLNYSLKTCPERLVEKYMHKYGNGNLETGLMVYFCGQGNFKRNKCGRDSKKRTWYIISGK